MFVSTTVALPLKITHLKYAANWLPNRLTLPLQNACNNMCFKVQLNYSFFIFLYTLKLRLYHGSWEIMSYVVMSNITPQHKLANINFFCLSNISPLCVCMVFWMVVIETINLTGLILISKHACCLVWNKEKKFYFELKECPLWKVEKLGNALFLLI